MKLTRYATIIIFPGRRTADLFDKLQRLFQKNFMKHLGFRDENGEYREGMLVNLLPTGLFVMEAHDPEDPIGAQEYDVHMKDVDW